MTCLTLTEGPLGIQSQRDVDGVITPMSARARALENDAAAFVADASAIQGSTPCASKAAGRFLDSQSAAWLTALTMGQRFGVIAILPTSIRGTCATPERWG